jgi:hypothetical protein
MTKALVKTDLKQKIIELLKSEKTGGNISLVCKLSGVSRQTVYNWTKEDEEFSQAIEYAKVEGKIEIADIAELGLIDKIKSGDITAIIFTLKNLRAEHYGEKKSRSEQPVDESTKDGEPKSPLEIYMWACMLNRHQIHMLQTRFPESKELINMYQEIGTVMDKYKNLIK